MAILFIVLGVSIFGMLAIPLRNLPKIRNGNATRAEVGGSSVVRAFLADKAGMLERWNKNVAREFFLKMADRMLRVIERASGKLAGFVKSMRVSVQEKFRVIPRESLYWKQIHSWRKTNGAGAVAHLADAGQKADEEKAEEIRKA